MANKGTSFSLSPPEAGVWERGQLCSQKENERLIKTYQTYHIPGHTGGRTRHTTCFSL